MKKPRVRKNARSRRQEESAARKQARYTVHPGVRMEAAIIRNLKRKTGRRLEEWIEVIDKSGPEAERARIAWLRERFGMGSVTAAFVSARAAGKNIARDYGKPESLIDAMYDGPRAALRPIHEALLQICMGLGPDVTATPCKTMVPLRRRYVFAQIKPAARSRIDFGLALGKTKASGRLLDTGGLAKGDRITHRIPLASLADIDTELRLWLQRAYDMDA